MYLHGALSLQPFASVATVVKVSTGNEISFGSFSVNLCVGPSYGACDTALHINPRYNQNNVVVRNSFINGGWGAEERGGAPFHVHKGQQLECILLITHDVIKVRQHSFAS